VIFVFGGIVVGFLAHAILYSDQLHIDPQVQNAIVLAIGGMAAAFFASVGVYWAAVHGGAVTQREGLNTRREARKASLIDRKTDIVGRVGVLASRHVQAVADQVASRVDLAGEPYRPLPRIPKATPIENRANQLYALGFQATGDVAQALLHAIEQLDEFAYVVTDDTLTKPITPLSDDEDLSFKAWQRVAVRVKTRLYVVSLTDEGVITFAEDGTLPLDYLDREYRTAFAELKPAADLARAFKAAKVQTDPTTAK
jgi:hypothetical protein